VFIGVMILLFDDLFFKKKWKRFFV
jgi:hypothetical protein